MASIVVGNFDEAQVNARALARHYGTRHYVYQHVYGDGSKSWVITASDYVWQARRWLR